MKLSDADRTPPSDWIPRENMRPVEAAWYTGISTSKLAKLRMMENREDGPRFVKISGCVIYKRSDLDDWIDRHAVNE
ncbi:helix-turn-helix transcriptional regulator [Nioella ostreopsis]|jgi:predicted DNA-binding transcriptional regulator AlpA|uniref:helix-turn-helix transcriptional regulator n=1 Tax=Nioella ostreopsis TaxID=2448479 RepID=UPI000FDC0FD5|nr:hypothetical protein [Nioella ostreopsis]